MKYIESQKLKEFPEEYRDIHDAVSWILEENYIYDFISNNFKNDSKILDVGCGNGYFLEKIRSRGYANIFGADIANYLKDKTISHQALDINVEKLKFENDSFDLVTAFQVLEHLENYFLIEQEANRILRSGGYFIFSIPHQFNIFYRIKFAITGNMTGFNMGNNHLLFLTKDVFAKTYLRDFVLIEKYYSKGPVPMLGRLNFVPGVKFPAKTRLLPRHELFADRICYVMRKK